MVQEYLQKKTTYNSTDYAGSATVSLEGFPPPPPPHARTILYFDTDAMQIKISL